MCARELGARTDSHDDAAFCNAVEGGKSVRQRHWVSQERQQDRRTKRDAGRRTRNRGKEGQRFASRTGQQRVADPYRVVAGLFGVPSRINDKFQVAVRPQQDLPRGEQKSSLG
jgi:hypothetical protein